MLVYMATPIEKAGKLKIKPINQKNRPKLRSTDHLECNQLIMSKEKLGMVLDDVIDNSSLPSSRSSLTSNSSTVSALYRSSSLNETDSSDSADKMKTTPISKKPRVKLKRTQPVLKSQLRNPVIPKSKHIRPISQYTDETIHTNSDWTAYSRTLKKRHDFASVGDIIGKTSFKAKRSNSIGSALERPQTFKSCLKRLNSSVSASRCVSFKTPSRSNSSGSSSSRSINFKRSLSRSPTRSTNKTSPSILKSIVKQCSGDEAVNEIADYVIRQCRIGSSVAFGLVHVNNNNNTTKKQPTTNGFTDGHCLVTIRMKPDEQGRFGFNVKGGADQGMPIIVSRVATNTPADLSIPRLNEGDQVLFINGRDMSQHTHEQVVMFIKASRETHSGELVLIVRPNVYVGEDASEEPDFSYTPETHTIASSNNSNTLQSSLLLLQESLESGAALAQFEQLYRKKPNMSMNSARLDCNIAKNRYRDISPYDQTRVVLKGSSMGDYVNANYVNMEIPGSGVVNRYIAAQGPLQNTCTDFWQMVWEQHCTLVVMLTTKVERGRVKCHQYWPELYETQDFGELQVTCVKEEDATSFAFREFNLTHVETNEERHIRHMQYISWPDHGVPDDPSDFLDFVVKVRQNRAGMVEPTVVHCSAGIGRTGVLITMETAMCLIEANQTCLPLQIVKNMRDQRAMLIQTSSQYKFVCEAILRVYNEGIVKPIDDFRR
ncbi:hypothetical protein SNE40_023087 [Patella caerulea]|uniref:Uncharacterized protein n=1 Tax=Patella caerulea TaxID=87958 RepID=A0AAN8G5K8_PATCE